MEKRIITISREFGSGGRTIGKLLYAFSAPPLFFSPSEVRESFHSLPLLML